MIQYYNKVRLVIIFQMKVKRPLKKINKIKKFLMIHHNLMLIMIIKIYKIKNKKNQKSINNNNKKI